MDRKEGSQMLLFSLIDINGGECCHAEQERASVAPVWDGKGWDRKGQGGDEQMGQKGKAICSKRTSQVG